MKINCIEQNPVNFGKLNIHDGVRTSVKTALETNPKIQKAFKDFDVDVLQSTTGINEKNLSISELDYAKTSNIGKKIKGFVISSLLFFINQKNNDKKDIITNSEGTLDKCISGTLDEIDTEMANFVNNLDENSFDKAITDTQEKRIKINQDFKKNEKESEEFDNSSVYDFTKEEMAEIEKIKDAIFKSFKK